MPLKRTQDRKTANFVNAAGKQSVIANAFSLPSGQSFSCPGATSVCENVCYAGRLEKVYKGFYNVVMHNWNLLSTADLPTMVEHLTEMVEAFDAECNKRGADKLFRIHADGDFFSEDYARAWAMVIRANPDIHFWVYTRSFTERLNIVPLLAGIDNLSMYLSADSDNLGDVPGILNTYPSVRVALLADTQDEAAETMLTLRERPGGKCPENVKQIPLITENGGACVSCGLCVFGKADVRFAVKKR